MIVELHGLEVFGRHGVLDDEERDGQTFLFDVPLEAAEPDIEVVAVSTFRETEPVEILEQPRFVNAAAAVETALTARELLDRLLGIENRLGRTREGPRFGPRTIDLDLLLYGDEEIAG